MNHPFPERCAQKRRVLYIEDHQDTIDLVSFVLSSAGLVCKSALSCNSARSHIRRRLSDVYLVDHRLPDGSGIDLIREIRNSDRNTPIVFFSADAHENTQQQALGAGAQECLSKPANPYLVLNAIRRQIASSRRRALQAAMDERQAVLEMVTERARNAVQKANWALSAQRAHEIRSQARMTFLDRGGTRTDFVKLWDSSILRILKPRFRIGDRVQRFGVTGRRDAGKVIAVIPNDQENDALTLYEIEFAGGRTTLHGFQIGPAS